MVYGGRISFALYLVHMCLFEVGRTVMDHVPGFANGTALGTLLLPQLLFVALLAAHLLHKYVEEPSRVWLRGVGPDRWWRSDGTVTAPPFASMPSDDTVVLAREQLIGMAPRSEPPVTVR
jgi:peptidoglycan/LPS O-acetylase OafA/YrhL